MNSIAKRNPQTTPRMPASNKLLRGDCLKILRTLAPNSIDLVCTDPPYGIGFMNHAWDTFSVRTAERTTRQGGDFCTFIAETGAALLPVLKPGGFLFMTMSPRQDSLAQALSGLSDAGFNTNFTSLYWTFASGFPKALNIGKAVAKRTGRPREVVRKYRAPDIAGGNKGKGKRPYTGKVAARRGGAGTLKGAYGGFQPKPAVEVVVVAMKPLSAKTFTDQALRNNKGVTWLDDCRIPAEAPISIHDTRKGTFAGGPPGRGSLANYRMNDEGRFPANLLVSDKVLDGGAENKCGGHSRYFSLDAWADTLPFLIVPKAKKRAQDGNSHPTVKPLALMSYLITLGSRPGDTVLDPFVGSGTTAVAAKLLNRRYVGIELEASYLAIARARVAAAASTRPN